MSSVLIVEQREQAGSDSYNRFEYQVHWIVCHIIGKLQEDAECIVFCEFHDDMAEFSPNNQQYQFFQIKTKEDSSDWTIAEMSKREKKKSGSYKKSFLGFIFYNYLTFGAECSHCHFVSNNDFDKEVLLWQSYIEDGKRLQTENIALYEKIKDRIKNEFLDDMPSNFDSVFEEFIQNTFVHKSEFVERFPELSLFYRLSSPLDSEMICIFPYFCPCEESAREIREILCQSMQGKLPVASSLYLSIARYFIKKSCGIPFSFSC